MAINNLKLSNKIADCTFTADQWELYDKEGRSAVAAFLNTRLTHSVNNLSDQDRVRAEMERSMGLYKHFGALDTEPRAFLEQVLGYIYGRG